MSYSNYRTSPSINTNVALSIDTLSPVSSFFKFVNAGKFVNDFWQ